VPATDIRNAYALDWAEGKQPPVEGPAWATLGYMKLRETLETVVAGMEAAAQDVDSVGEPEPASSEAPKNALSGS
jgi:hypothetical protein